MITNLSPIINIVTSCSFTYMMLSNYIDVRDALHDLNDNEIDNLLPSRKE